MKRLITIIALLAICMSCTVVYGADLTNNEYGDKADSWRYKNGQPIDSLLRTSERAVPYHPEATLTGIDVSHHQGEIDWEKVKAAGIDFAIIRCGWGMDDPGQDDRYFERNVKECERLDIPYGVYLYSYADSTYRAGREADHVLKMIEGHNLSYPVFYDMEDNSVLGNRTKAENVALMASVATAFCEKIEAAGYPAGVYANTNWWNNYLTDSCFDQWHRWVAQYNVECTYKGKYGIWQYTSDGRVNGIDGRVDMNFQIGYPEDHGSPVNRIIRYAGIDRYDTAIFCADNLKIQMENEQFDNIIVASGENYPDALAGSYLAKVKHSPIVLTSATVDDMVAEYAGYSLSEDGTVYLLGGTGAVTAELEQMLDDRGINVKRLAGNNRYDTNIAILKEANVADEDILICSGDGFADSLSASAVGLPIMLVNSEITEVQQEYLDSLDTEKMYLVGGTGAVNKDIEEYLAKKYEIKRFAGITRYATSALVAGEFFPQAETAVLAYAQNFPDGLSGGPLAISMDSPLLLVDNNSYNDAAEYASKAGIIRTVILGGPALISDEIANNILIR